MELKLNDLMINGEAIIKIVDSCFKINILDVEKVSESFYLFATKELFGNERLILECIIKESPLIKEVETSELVKRVQNIFNKSLENLAKNFSDTNYQLIAHSLQRFYPNMKLSEFYEAIIFGMNNNIHNVDYANWVSTTLILKWVKEFRKMSIKIKKRYEQFHHNYVPQRIQLVQKETYKKQLLEAKIERKNNKGKSQRGKGLGTQMREKMQNK